ncbi:endonuclease III domain-containing protein [Methanobacterium aggregans]|uniref:endonuclease III domain-containing protein n=1 Tax=Methanobacterium aggregans TaxID=1615586 RepID=UPI001AE66EDE|nr:endonuclease III domain-containing protein [Methanobacterium aggregans]
MNKGSHQVIKIYQKLYDLYGPQGWWPLTNHEGSNPTKTGSLRGYHPENYELPKKDDEIYEIILGAILTQNTTWTSAEQALKNLNDLNAIKPEKLLELSDETLKAAIRCAGFLNQKATYLREVTKFFISLKGRTPGRKEILSVKGVGNETADSILLYAYKKPEFVVDAYTKRIFSHLGLIPEKAGYMEVKELFESNLPKEVPVYQEYHALIVEHAKRHYQKKPYGVDDPLRDLMD